MKRLSGLLLALLSSSAMAAEGSWTGFYLGGNLGYGWGHTDPTMTLGENWSAETQALRDYFDYFSEKKLSPEGVTFGIQGGYDYQFSDSRWVLGVEMDYSELDLSESYQSGQIIAPLGFVASFDFRSKVDAKRAFSVRPKLGYTFDDTMLFVTAGCMWTSAEFSYEVAGTNGYSKAGRNSKLLTSVVWGLGVEHKFTDNISAKLEYLRSNTDDAGFTTQYRNNNFLVPSYSEKFDVDFNYDVLRVGVNYRF